MTTSTVDTEYLNHWDWLAPFWDISLPDVEAEERFYVEEARKAGPAVLDIACGTGRLVIRMAEEGFSITGLDFSPAMLDHARTKTAMLSDAARSRVKLVQGDMREFALGQRFHTAVIAWSFIYLLTPEEQRRALACIHRHLEDGGQLIFSVPDPKLESIPANLSHAAVPRKTNAFVRPDNSHTVLVWVSTEYSLENQTVEFLTSYEELDDEGHVIAKTYKRLTMRFTLRQEMLYLLELCGFEVAALYGDHARSPFRPGSSQVWVARKRAVR